MDRESDSGRLSHPDNDIASAWSALSRLGRPGRYCGRGQDGRFEYLITDGRSGTGIATGRGRTIAAAIRDAIRRAGRQTETD